MQSLFRNCDTQNRSPARRVNKDTTLIAAELSKNRFEPPIARYFNRNKTINESIPIALNGSRRTVVRRLAANPDSIPQVFSPK